MSIPTISTAPSAFQPDREEPSVLDAIVIGAGHAGLSTSYWLLQKGLSHVVLERGEIGEAWRSRWDSFQLNTPNKFTYLPGMKYDGPDPDGFGDKHELMSFLARYAAKFQLPVLCNTPVVLVERREDVFRVETPRITWTARCLVVATGQYGTPETHSFDGHFPDDVLQLHSNQYRNPRQLHPGGVLVIGGGQSGLQIAEELREDGRHVFWCISGIPCNYRRYAGADFMHWWIVGGIMHREVHEHPWVRAGEPEAIRRLRAIDYPLVSGKGGNGLGHSISLSQLWEDGVVLLGRLDRVDGHVVYLKDDLLDSVATAHAGTRLIESQLRDIAARFGARDDKVADDTDWFPPEIIRTLDLREKCIRNVILATGLRPEWSWLKVPDFRDAMGYPDGARGVTSVPGLYFNGLFYLQRLSSTCLCNGGRDAAYIVSHIERYLEQFAMRAGAAAE